MASKATKQPKPGEPRAKYQRMHRKRRQRRGYELVLVIGDTHHRYVDHGALGAVRAWAKDYQPDRIIQIGDNIDGKALGRWPKAPEEMMGLQDEFDMARTFWAEFKMVCPDATLVQLEGNHEERLQLALWQSPGLHTLRTLTIASLMGCHEMGVEYYQRTHRYWIRKDLKLLAMHGNQVSQNSGYSVHNEVLKRHCSVVIGHVHRLGMVHHTGELETWTGVECGHLATPENNDYLRGKCANHQQGFAIFYLFDTWFQPVLVPIVHGRFTFEGKVYGNK